MYAFILISFIFFRYRHGLSAAAVAAFSSFRSHFSGTTRARLRRRYTRPRTRRQLRIRLYVRVFFRFETIPPRCKCCSRTLRHAVRRLIVQKSATEESSGASSTSHGTTAYTGKYPSTTQR